MKKIIIGIDPDSDKHGVAIYVDGELKSLNSWRLLNLVAWIDSNPEILKIIEVHIESVCVNSAVFRVGYKVKTQQSLARRLGKCQQSQIELERIFEHYNITIIRHKISKNWKDSKTGKVLLEKHTGWKGKSNEDTRSAAWFGYLGVMMSKGRG